jgi:hypothetical protein
MPTAKPRVQVTLEPETHAVIERFASLQGRTRGAIIADLLDSITPAITRTVALLEAAAAAPDSIKDGLRAVVEGAQADLADASGDAAKQLDLLMQQLGAGEGNPHVVTRGSGMDSPTPRKSSKRRSNPSKPPLSEPPTDEDYRGVIKALVAEKKRGAKRG